MDARKVPDRQGGGVTATRTPAPQAFRSIIDDLEDRARDMGVAEAFRIYRDGAGRDAPGRFDAWTWRDVRDRARGVARELAAHGVAGGARVLLAYPAGLEFVAAFLGCLYAAAVPVPASPPRRREALSRWDQISADADISAVLCAEAVRDRLGTAGEGDGRHPCIVSAAADPARPYRPRADDPPPPSPAAGDVAFLQYTSGSTSAPKGVVVTHGMLSANLEQIRRAFDFRPDDRIVGWLPQYHDMGLIGGVLTPVHIGAPNAMMSPAAFLRDPIRYLELAGELRATVIGGPNFGFDLCVRHATPEALERVDLSAVRCVFSGAETIRVETLRRFHETFAGRGFAWRMWAGCYGMAEATLCVSVTPMADPLRLIEVEAAPLAAHAVAPGAGVELAESGALADGLEAAIVALDAARRLPPDRVGEIWLRGPNVAAGYWRKPEINAAVFDRRLDGEGGWMRTGDLGAIVDGRIYVTGRVKEIIVVRGRNHYPHDIEATAAAAHPDVMPGRVAAFPLTDGADDGVGLVCELERRACHAARAEPVFAAIRAAVAEGHGLAPRAIALVRPGSLPVTPSGKIQRFACRDGLGPEGWLKTIAEWRSDAIAPRASRDEARGRFAKTLRATPGPLRRAKVLAHLRETLTRALGPAAAISDDGRFFDMGLDSASGVALVGELERAMDIVLDTAAIYEYPTPAALADHLLARLFEAPAATGTRGAASADDDLRALEALLASER